MKLSIKTLSQYTDYDPHKNRPKSLMLTQFEVFQLIFNGSIGSNVLANSFAFQDAGYVTAITYTSFLTFIYGYAMLSMINARYALSVHLEVPHLTYQQTVKYALDSGPAKLRAMVSFITAICDGFLIIYNLTLMAVYADVMIACMQLLHSNVFGGNLLPHWTIHVVMIVASAVSIRDRNLKNLIPIVTAANVLFIAGLTGILYFMYDQQHNRIVHGNFLYTFNFRTLPWFLLTVSSAIESSGLLLIVDDNTANPKLFGRPFGMWTRCLIIVCALYIAISSLTVDLKTGKFNSLILQVPNDIWGHLVTLALLLSAFLTFAIASCVPYSLMWENYLKEMYRDFQFAQTYEKLLRYGIGVFAWCIALWVPHLDIFNAFVNTFCVGMLSFALPGIVEFCVLYPDAFGRFSYKMYADFALILFGFVAIGLFLYAAIPEIIADINAKTAR